MPRLQAQLHLLALHSRDRDVLQALHTSDTGLRSYPSSAKRTAQRGPVLHQARVWHPASPGRDAPEPSMRKETATSSPAVRVTPAESSQPLVPVAARSPPLWSGQARRAPRLQPWWPSDTRYLAPRHARSPAWFGAASWQSARLWLCVHACVCASQHGLVYSARIVD